MAIYVKENQTWKEVASTRLSIYNEDTWKPVDKAYVNDNGIWKQIYVNLVINQPSLSTSLASYNSISCSTSNPVSTTPANTGTHTRTEWQRATNSSFTSNVSTRDAYSGSGLYSTTFSGLGESRTYYFRVRVYIDGTPSVWSVVSSRTTGVRPSWSAPSVSASTSVRQSSFSGKWSPSVVLSINSIGAYQGFYIGASSNIKYSIYSSLHSRRSGYLQRSRLPKTSTLHSYSYASASDIPSGSFYASVTLEYSSYSTTGYVYYSF